MILKASQRGNAGELARHLLNEQDNEHVEVHAISGFMAETVPGALQEAHALSLGTKCQQPLFSVSLSPPKEAPVSCQGFEEAIGLISEKLGLDQQPHLIVFHEKNARRHCHVVFSRINSQTMTAINLPYFKNKLMEVSKELYIKHGWQLPQGHIDRQKRNPLNFTREQWQQAKRLNEDPKRIKQTLKECWAVSDNRKSFTNALAQHGFYLAKGDRRGFVAIDWRGEVYSLSRWLNVKTPALKQRLGEPKHLPSVDQTKADLDQALRQRIGKLTNEIKQYYSKHCLSIQADKANQLKRHRQQRKALENKHVQRWQKEQHKRQARLVKGVRGLWDRLTGKHGQAVKQNECEAYQALCRDRKEKDDLIHRQLNEKNITQSKLDRLLSEQHQDIDQIKQAVFSQLPEDKINALQQEFDQSSQKNEHYHELNM